MDYFDNMFSYLPLGFCTISVFAQFWHPAYALAPPLKSTAGEAMHPLAPLPASHWGYMMQLTFTVQY